MDLASLQTTVARISARLNENLSETARDLGLQGIDPSSLAGAGTAGRYLEDGTVISQDGVRETKKLLETRREASMAEGLRRVLAMMLRGLPVVTFFPQVVQCLSSSTSSTSSSSASNIQIRSLVSLYILRQAAIEPELALLAVNMYQKDLRDPNPVVRALAIRTLAGMELESIVTLVLMSLKTASRDTNWFVRRTVAEALERVYVLDPSHLSSLIPIMETGLADTNPLVTGSCLAAFERICPDRLDLIHPHYRRICKSLVDADEWTQVVVLKVMERYARHEFAEPTDTKQHPDLALLLQCAEPLLWNRNPAVVLSVVRMTYRLSPQSFSKKHAASLARLLQAAPEIQCAVLASIAAIASVNYAIFAQHFLHHFFIYHLYDTEKNKALKLQILVSLADADNIETILRELSAYAKTSDPAFALKVVNSIGRCAKKVMKVQESCLNALMDLLDETENDEVTYVLLQEISSILLSPTISPSTAKPALDDLLLHFCEDRFASPRSMAAFYGAMGSIVHLLTASLPSVLDVIRSGVKAFLSQGKTALLKLSEKVVVLCQKQTSLELLAFASSLHTHLLTLGRYDPSWSVRATTRLYSGLTSTIGLPTSDEPAADNHDHDAFASGEALSSAPMQPSPQDPPNFEVAIQVAILSTSPTVSGQHGHTAQVSYFETLAGWQQLPEWSSSPPQHTLRDSTMDTAAASTGKAYRGFGNSPHSRESRNSKNTNQSSSRRKFTENVVLVPTESNNTASTERPRTGGLQAFLQSSDESEDSVEETESDSETATDDDSSSSDESESKGHDRQSMM